MNDEKLKLEALNDIKKYFKMMIYDLEEVANNLDSKDTEKSNKSLVAAMAVVRALSKVPNFVDEIINDVMQKEKEKQEE